MKDWVKQKLDAIAELYPTERIAASKERLTRMWNGEKPLDRYPFVFYGGIKDSSEAHKSSDEATAGSENHLRSALNAILNRKGVEDDFIPTIWSGCRQSIMPSIFGAPEVLGGTKEETDYLCERILQGVEDIEKLPEPSIQPGTPAHEIISLQQYLLEETEELIPIHVADMQGPADACGKMWGYDNLFLCARDKPEAYDRLMTKVADGFIYFWKRQQEILGDCFVNTHLMDWMPRSAGVTMSVDSMVMLSPPFYEQFYQPYISKVGEAFGGITIHACGQFKAIVKKICATPFLKGFDTSDMLLEVLLAAGFDTKTIVSNWYQLEDVGKWFDIIRQHAIRCDLKLYGLWPSQEASSWTDADWQKIQAGVDRALAAAHL